MTNEARTVDGIPESPPIGHSHIDQSELLRLVDRSELDRLIAAFTAVVGLPAAVITTEGILLIGGYPTGRLCPLLLPSDVRCGLLGQPVDADHQCCLPGFSCAVQPVMLSGTGGCGTVIVGPFIRPEARTASIEAGLLARGVPRQVLRMTLGAIPRATQSQANAAARLLGTTLGVIVHEASAASEHVGLLGRQRQTNRELAVLYEVTRALNSGLELEAILQRLADSVGEALGVDGINVGLVEGDELVTKASWGVLTSDARTSRLKVGEGFAGRVASSGETLTCTDMQGDPRLYLTATTSREDFHAFAGVPIKVDGTTVGVLSLYRRTPYTFPKAG